MFRRQPAQKQKPLAPYRIEVGQLTDVGRHRETNEDCCFVAGGRSDLLARKGVLALVADGMGGHAAGEEASRIAAEVIPRQYYEGPGDSRAALRAAFERANRQIHTQARRNRALRGMGTTCTALVVQDGEASMAHVGDSRLYLIRGGDPYRMSQDDSLVMELVRQRVISEEEARQRGDRNVLLRALGTQRSVAVATWEKPFPVQASDCFVLCSDGLHDLVEDEEIGAITTREEPQRACDLLVELAKERGGYDNITVVILSIQPAVEPPTTSVGAALGETFRP